jgi:arginase
VRVALVVVPYHLGRDRIGMGAGPEALVEAGLPAALRGDGHDVDIVRVERSGEATNEVAASFEVVRAVAEQVREAETRGAFPLVLAGNCMTSIGVVAGIGRDVSVVWLDAHADFNTAEGTTSGFADGMGLSILTGTGWDALRATVPGYRSVPEANVLLVGARDTDPAEDERLDRSAITVVDPQAVDSIGSAVGRLSGHVGDAYLHVDLVPPRRPRRARPLRRARERVRGRRRAERRGRRARRRRARAAPPRQGSLAHGLQPERGSEGPDPTDRRPPRQVDPRRRPRG